MAFPRHSLSPTELAAIIEAEREGQPFLVYRDGARELRLEQLRDVERLTVGRSEHSELALPWDAEVSRTHAQLERVGADWTLVDDGLSRNGSFVNGQRVRGRRRLDDGDVMTFGRTSVVFRAPVATAESTVVGNATALVRLTPAEQRVLVALCAPFVSGESSGVPPSSREIAERLNLSVDGVKTHVKALFAKLEIGDLPQYRKRTQLALRALELGLVTAREVEP